MNTEAEHWSIHCMDARRRWYVMTSEGWQREDEDCLLHALCNDMGDKAYQKWVEAAKENL